MGGSSSRVKGTEVRTRAQDDTKNGYKLYGCGISDFGTETFKFERIVRTKPSIARVLLKLVWIAWTHIPLAT